MTNEEKIKEMWNKLMYSMCRCPTSKMIKMINYLFSVLTAFQFMNKQFYEQFILKKLEFEPLMTELAERLKIRYQTDIMDELKRNSRTRVNLCFVKSCISNRLIDELVEGGLHIKNSELELISTLGKLQVHLLRLMS